MIIWICGLLAKQPDTHLDIGLINEKVIIFIVNKPH